MPRHWALNTQQQKNLCDLILKFHQIWWNVLKNGGRIRNQISPKKNSSQPEANKKAVPNRNSFLAL
jgi:hypothetical protein